MVFRKRSGYAAYPILAFLLFVPLVMRAQDSGSAQAADSSQSQMDDAQQSSSSQQSQVLREAQERVNARRKIRVRQIIRDTYSHKYEFDFGGGYLRFRPGNSLQHNSETGWQVDITDYIRGDWAVAAEARGYYGTAYTGSHVGTGISNVFLPSISQYAFLAGPKYRFFKGQHWGWTGQILAGADHGNFGTGTNGLPPYLVGLYSDSTVLSISAGASVDYNLSPTLAVRLTPNALITDFGSTLQENLGWNAGLVYRWGRHK